ncbi:hypothetical protein HHI36_009932 [Cryptolaemus montrouzieri]|uniref:Uncharacterized protein n=1 Tax=Cryptolaemus montrouzieri TaxID=559131 RepID=A0ABD2MH91_9CUCU
MNKEIENILGEENIVKTIKARRIQLYGHVKRMKDRQLRKILERRPEGKRTKGRPRNGLPFGWEDEVVTDLIRMDVKGLISRTKKKKRLEKNSRGGKNQ